MGKKRTSFAADTRCAVGYGEGSKSRFSRSGSLTIATSWGRLAPPRACAAVVQQELEDLIVRLRPAAGSWPRLVSRHCVSCVQLHGALVSRVVVVGGTV
jgi:hypothetical protein